MLSEASDSMSGVPGMFLKIKIISWHVLPS